jgi:hypothetical protein
VRSVGKTYPEWAAYADDVIEQLTRNGLCGYQGAPVLDDLVPMNAVNAVAAVNRITLSARQFFRDLTGQARFAELGLGPRARSHEMWRDGTSRALSASPDDYVLSTLASYFTAPRWPSNRGAFAAFYFGGDSAQIAVGAYDAHTDWLTSGFANSDTLDTVNAPASHLRANTDARLPIVTATESSVWRYDERPWTPPVDGDDAGMQDLIWAIEALDAAVATHDLG